MPDRIKVHRAPWMHWGYARVSGQEQSEGFSLDAQIRRLVEAGVPREQVLVEVASASKAKTTMLFKLFAKAKRGEVSSITALRADRFARTRAVQARMWNLIDEHKVKFTFLDQGGTLDPSDPSSCFQFSILGAAAVFETEMLTQRVRNGLEQTRLLKRHHGRAPWGYICVDGKLEKDPENWFLAKAVIDEYLKTGSSTEARRLKHKLTEKAIGISAFARWIQSPTLRGGVIRRSKDEDGKVAEEIFWGMHEPLIESGQWEQIQAIRKKNRVNAGAFRNKETPSIGSGLFVCAGCRSVLSKVTKSSRKKAVYRCRQIKGTNCPQGHLNWIAMDDVADHIRRALKIGAIQIADAETPVKLAEPPELSALKKERDDFRRMNSARANQMADELDNEIAEFERRVAMTSEGRQKQIQEEFERFTDPWTLEALTDDELRSLALRYGLKFVADNKKVVELTWGELGPQKPGVFAVGALEAVDGPAREIDRTEVMEAVKEALDASG